MARRENSKANPWIISYGRTDYDGSAIDTLTPIHKAQQIHKYRLGLFVTGIVALVAALINLSLIAVLQINGANTGVSSAITGASIIFVITLLIDIIFTINLNRYIKGKQWLILYIPCLVLMIVFSVPQIMTLISLLVPSVHFEDLPNFEWANYVNIAVCGIFVIAETVRIIFHWHDLDLKQEIRKALK
ncbi:MAG: hypothetical protein KBS35_02205 [Mycoplasma sp.]|nr:hypothetical protein [Candidatus Hennigella equi]